MSGSVAEAVNERVLPSPIVRSVIAPKAGGLFDSSTITVKLWVALREGEPLSATRIAITFVLPPCVSDGVQLNTPLVREAPVGAPGSKLYVSACAGISLSLAKFVNVSSVPSRTVLLLIAASVGALFTSFTITVNVLVSLRAGVPLSVTRTTMLLVPGPCASEGVHVKTPLLDPIAAPVGAPGSRLKVRV